MAAEVQPKDDHKDYIPVDKLDELNQQISFISNTMNESKTKIQSKFNHIRDILAKREQELLIEMESLENYYLSTIDEKINLIKNTKNIDLNIDNIRNSNIDILFEEEQDKLLNDVINSFGKISQTNVKQIKKVHEIKNNYYSNDTPSFISASTNEIITISIGECANNISNLFWNVLHQEHEINTVTPSTTTNHKIGAFYHESKSMYIPRAIAVDLDANCNVSNLIPTNNILLHDSVDGQGGGTCGNWARGMYIDGKEIIDTLMDKIHHEVEKCDGIDGFNLLHSTGGGTGSGLTSLILEKLHVEYRQTCCNTFSILPSMWESISCWHNRDLPPPSSILTSNPFEMWNTTLCLHYMIENCSLNMLIDNDIVYNRTRNFCLDDIENVTKEMNRFLVSCLGDVMSPFRFESKCNLSLHDVAMSMVLKPRLHFASLSYVQSSELVDDDMDCAQLSVELDKQSSWLMNGHAIQMDDMERQRQYLCSLSIFRGIDYRRDSLNVIAPSIGSREKVDARKLTFDFVSVPSKYNKISAVTLLNSDVVRGNALQRIHDKSHKSYSSGKPYMHWYVGQGMEEGELCEALENLKFVAREYEDETKEEEEEDEEEDEDEDEDEDEEEDEEEEEDY